MSPVSCTRVRSSLRILVAVLALALVATVTPGAATATATTKQQIQAVQRKADALGRKVSVLAEQYDVARIHLAAAQRRSNRVEKQVKAQQANVERMRKKISALAASAYMGGPADLSALVTARSPQDFLDKASSLELLSDQDRRSIASFSKASDQLATQRAAAAKALTAQRKLTASIGNTRSTILSALAKQKKLLAQLKTKAAREAQAKARAAAQRRAEQRAKARAAAARASRATRQPTSSPTSSPSNPPSTSGKVSKVIAYAQAQIGKPYQWGADGPSSFDCSGLTMMAWRQAGVSLPHSSSMQYSSGGPHVSKSQLRPGDLVFFYQPISHVALYVGNGRMITAPQTGENVKYADFTSSYYQSNYSGAVRPG